MIHFRSNSFAGTLVWSVLVLCFVAQVYADDKEGWALFKMTWRCKVEIEAGVSFSVEGKYEQYSGRAKSGNTHLFEGVGEEAMSLRWEEDKPGTPADQFLQLPVGGPVLTYFQGGNNAPLVMWRFFSDKKIAVKTLSYIINGSITSSTNMYQCEIVVPVDKMLRKQ